MNYLNLILFLTLLNPIRKTPTYQTQSVCSKDNLPTGWVVTNINKQCMGCCGAPVGRWGTSYTITKIDGMSIGSTISVCIKDNLPTGWVVVSENSNCIGCCGAVGAERGWSYVIKRI